MYAHSTAGTLSSQSSLLILQFFVSPFVSVLLKDSIAPLAWG